jgi:arylsulfatase A-like enzyme
VQARGRADGKSLVDISVTRLSTNYVTLAETLKAAGYVTGHFGKWHLGAEPFSPLQQGFDVDVPHWSGPGPAGSYVAPWKFPSELHFTGQPGEHIEDRMASEAVKFIHANKDHPFFLNYWSFSVHAPYDAKRSYVQQAALDMDEDLPQHNPVYAAMVHSLDDAVGTLVRTLEANGLMDKTIIVFFSDNGGVNWQALKTESARKGPNSLTAPYENIPPTSNQPLRGGKACIYEGGTREPCFVIWPGVVQSGTRTAAMIQGMDFYPTLAEMVGAPLPADQIMDGRSFLPVLKGQSATARDTIFNFFPHTIKVNGQVPAASVRQGDWKLIRFFNDGSNQADRFELYNLHDDLSESNNLAVAQPERVKILAALLDNFLKETKAVVPGPNPAYDPKAEAQTGAKAASADALQGWKLRGCAGAVKADGLTVTGKSPDPFLAFAAGKFAGPTVVKFRIRSANGAAGKVEWLPSPQQTDEAKSVPFALTGGAWQELSVNLPATGPLNVLRLHLPATETPVQLAWLELQSANGKTQRWNFQ